jgi:hypothetical protein
VRQVNLIKRGRAAISHKILQQLHKVAAVVLPENIHNYDEINIQERPGE